MNTQSIAKIEVKDGEVFYPKNDSARHNHRRVVGIIGDRVFYSVGGGAQLQLQTQNFSALGRG
jgi:hypothetical protein